MRIRVVNVVDLMKLEPESEHSHGLSDAAYDALFATDKHIIFAFHGYPWLIHTGSTASTSCRTSSTGCPSWVRPVCGCGSS